MILRRCQLCWWSPVVPYRTCIKDEVVGFRLQPDSDDEHNENVSTNPPTPAHIYEAMHNRHLRVEVFVCIHSKPSQWNSDCTVPSFCGASRRLWDESGCANCKSGSHVTYARPCICTHRKRTAYRVCGTAVNSCGGLHMQGCVHH
jgi:hypothetical protein